MVRESKSSIISHWDIGKRMPKSNTPTQRAKNVASSTQKVWYAAWDLRSKMPYGSKAYNALWKVEDKALKVAAKAQRNYGRIAWDTAANKNADDVYKAYKKSGGRK